MEPTGNAFAEVLRRFRLNAGLTQEALAERARLSVEAVSALERGVRRAPFSATTALLAEALGLGATDRAALEAAAARPRRSLSNPEPRRNAPSPAAAPRHPLPELLSRTVGRQAVLPVVSDLLDDERLVTLVGTGGVGKTRLALEVARSQAGNYRDGVRFVELAPLSNPALVGQTLAAALHVRLMRGSSAIALCAAALRDRELLIVLDNCEHLIDEAARVSEALLRTGSRACILATSRERLNVSGERVYRLPSLTVPPSGEIASEQQLLSYGACELFVARARAVDDRFEVDVHSRAHIAEICRRLDGIPLAIELAAARARVFSPAQLASRLDERFRILTGGSRTALPRQQTMRATLDWSYDLLAANDRLLFGRLAIFAGGWTLDAARAVCAGDPLDVDDVVDALTSLVEKSLVVAEFAANNGRYRLLESTRAYAAEKLRAGGEYDQVAQRHAAWVGGLTIGFRKAYYSVSREHWLRQLRPEIDNIRAALSYALDSKSNAALTGRILWLARLSNALSPAESQPNS